MSHATALPDGQVIAVSYLRVSTKEQAEREGDPEGYSIPAQREANKRKAESLGATVVAEFVDRGESARSANRPQLRALLSYVKQHRVDLVIVHKVDRLARNRFDDVEINLALTQAGVTLVSATENIDETPSGMLLHGIMSSIAEFYSRNLATEVIKGMGQKAKGGGTVGVAPIGYLNARSMSSEGREIRVIQLDPVRGPLVRWAFEAYAGGSWSLNSLTAELEARGLTSRPTPSRPSKALAVSQIHRMLRSPYYRGIVIWRGGEYVGRHERLIDDHTWLTVQDVLKTKRVGEKERQHNHYLKSSVFCGACGARLIITKAKNAQGTVYPYFVCGSRHQKRNDCTAKAVLIETIEDEVAEFYKCIQLSADLRAAVEARLNSELQKIQTAQSRERATIETQLRHVKDQQAKLLQAHYASALPLDLMAAEQTRLTSQRDALERRLEAMQANHELIRCNLSAALDLVQDCAAAYRAASPKLRRMFNQALFAQLEVYGDHTKGNLQEPFKTLYGAVGAVPTVGSALTIEIENALYRRSDVVPDLGSDGPSLKEAMLVPPTGFEPVLPP